MLTRPRERVERRCTYTWTTIDVYNLSRSLVLWGSEERERELLWLEFPISRDSANVDSFFAMIWVMLSVRKVVLCAFENYTVSSSFVALMVVLLTLYSIQILVLSYNVGTYVLKLYDST